MPPVIHRFRTIALVVTAALLSVGLFLALRPREPTYEERRLTEWLGDFSLSQKQDTEEPAERAKHAGEAVRHIGTNCLPLLLKMLQARDSAVKTKLVDWAARQSLIQFNFTSAGDIRDQALTAYAMLGPVARPAIPELTLLLHQERTARDAGCALARIGPEAITPLASALTNQVQEVRLAGIRSLIFYNLPGRQVVPILIQSLQHPDPGVRQQAAAALSRWADQSELIVPALIAALPDRDPAVVSHASESLVRFKEHRRQVTEALLKTLGEKEQRAAASSVLGALRQIAPGEPDLIVPAVTKALDDRDAKVRYEAVAVLGNFGARARIAVPSLLRLYHNGEEPFRQSIGSALLQIAPEAAATIGFTPPASSPSARP